MELAHELPKLVALAAAISAAYLAARIGLRGSIARELARREVSAAALEAIYKPLEYLSLVFAGLATLYILYRDPLTAGLLALAAGSVFAATYPVLSNMIAYYVVILEHRVRAGDILELHNGIRGRVVRVTPLYIALRGRGGQMIVIPNRILVLNGFRKIAAGPTYARLSIELSVPRGMENLLATITDIEGKVKTALQQRRIVQKPQDVLVVVSSLEPSHLELEVHVPITSPDLKPSTLNAIVKYVAEALAAYDPRIKADTSLVT